MKIFVTGADSFVAKNFMERYQNRHKFFVPAEDFDPTDINAVIKEFRRRKVDGVLHCAEYAGKKAEFDADVELKNVLMFKNIQSVASAYGVKKIVVISNEREFSDQDEWTLITEEERVRLKPEDSYGYAKYMVTDFARFDKNVVILRPFNAYGKYMPKESFLYKTAEQAFSGKDITVDNDGLFSAVYIDDLTKIANEFLLRDYPSGDYNIVHGEPVSRKAVLNRLKRESGTPFKITSKEQAPERTVSNAKFLGVVGGTYRFTSIRSGLGRFYKWISDTND